VELFKRRKPGVEGADGRVVGFRSGGAPVAIDKADSTRMH